MTEYANIQQVGNQLADFIQISMTALTLGINMFEGGALIGAVQTLVEESVNKMLIDVGNGFSNITTDRNADLYIYWAELSQRNHATMLYQLSKYMSDQYQQVGNNLINNEFDGNFAMLHDIVMGTYMGKALELERDYSLALRTFQIKEKESILKSALYNTAIEQEADRALTVFNQTNNEFDSGKLKFNNLKQEIQDYKISLDNAFYSFFGSNLSQEYLTFEKSSSTINPIPINN